MKTKIIFAAALFMTIMFHEISFSQTSISIRLGPTTGQDCQLLSYADSLSTPNSTEIVAASWTYSWCFNLWRPLIRFNLTEIPAGQQVISARLSLYGNPNPSSSQHSGANESYIRKVTSHWDQYQVFWETQPDYSTENQVMLPESTSPMQDYLNIDVTELVREMVSNPSTNFGFIIMNKVESRYRCLNFASSECPDINKRPKLDIVYNTVGIEPVSSNVPTDYSLSQNFPNPFNPVTNIKFDLPKSSFTVVEIFDELGRKASVLVNEMLSAGSYNVQWDGNNFSSGNYFIRLKSGDVLLTKKITLLK